MSFPDPQEIKSRAITVGIFRLDTAITGFRLLVNAIGTVKDMPQLRNDLRYREEARKHVEELVQEISEKLKHITDVNQNSTVCTALKHITDANQNSSPSDKIAVGKLERDFIALLQDFRTVQEVKSAKLKALASVPLPSRAPSTFVATLPTIVIYTDSQEENQTESLAVTARIFRLNTALAGLRRMVKAMGTPKDTPELRQKLEQSQKHIEELMQETTDKLKYLTNADRNNSQAQRIINSKLARDLELVLQDFHKVQNLAAKQYLALAIPPSITDPLPTRLAPKKKKWLTKMKKVIFSSKIKNGSSSRSGESRSSVGFENLNSQTDATTEDNMLLWNQKRCEIQTYTEVDFNEATIKENEKGIKDIQQQVEEINEIYKNLSLVIHEPTLLDVKKISTPIPQVKEQFIQSSKAIWCCTVLLIIITVLAILIILQPH